MSSTHVELRVSFFVSSDLDDGLEAAQYAIQAIERLAATGDLDGCYSFSVSRAGVNGNAWEDRWPEARENA